MVDEDQTLGSDSTLTGVPEERTETADLRRGTMVGRYVVLEHIGRGGMGVVYSAYDPKLDRRVALKLLISVRAQDLEARVRLEREAQAMARLSHPNTVTIHDVGDHDDQIYLAMEYIDGATLKVWREAKHRHWSEEVAVFRDAARGLAAAHREGITHRDFKPDNVMIESSGRVVVMDFGLARRTTESSPSASEEALAVEPVGSEELTRTGSLLGTPAYMSPEQLARHDVGPASDQFSFFVALYEGLFGERPFAGDTFGELAAAIRANRRQPVPARPSIPRWLAAAIDRGLSPSPEARHSSMDEVVEVLGRASSPKGRRSITVMAVGVAGLAIGAGIYGLDDGVEECERGARLIDETWSPARAAELRGSFEGIGLPLSSSIWASTEAGIDGWAAQWRESYFEICAETRVRGGQSRAAAQVRMQCLDEHKAGLEALLAEFASVDEPLLLRAQSTVANLASPGECHALDATGEDVVAADDRSDHARFSNVLARQAARFEAGRFESVATELSALIEDIAPHPWPTLLARTTALRANALARSDRVEEALALHRAALRHAAKGRDRTLEATIWLDLLNTTITLTPTPADADPLLLPAELAIEAAGRPPHLMMLLERTRGTLAAERGHALEAVKHQQRALELVREAELPAVSLEVGLDNLGNALFDAGRYAEAEPLQRQSLELVSARLGPDHPTRANGLTNLAQTCTQLGNHDCARAAYEEALTILERSVGSEHTRYADALYNFAVFEYERLDMDASRRHTKSALAIWTRRLGADNKRVAAAQVQLGNLEQHEQNFEDALQWFGAAEQTLRAGVGEDHPDVAVVVNNRANATRFLGRLEESLRLYDQAIALRTAHLGDDHPNLAFPLCNKAEVLVELGRAAEAVPVAARAVELRERAQARPGLLGIAYFAEAQARWDAQDDQARAVELARRALAAFERAETGEPEERRARVEAWLAARAPASGPAR